MRLNLHNIFYYLQQETPHKVNYEQVLKSFFILMKLISFFKELFPGMFIKIISSSRKIGTVVLFHTGNSNCFENYFLWED